MLDLAFRGYFFIKRHCSILDSFIFGQTKYCFFIKCCFCDLVKNIFPNYMTMKDQHAHFSTAKTALLLYQINLVLPFILFQKAFEPIISRKDCAEGIGAGFSWRAAAFFLGATPDRSYINLHFREQMEKWRSPNARTVIYS